MPGDAAVRGRLDRALADSPAVLRGDEVDSRRVMCAETPPTFAAVGRDGEVTRCEKPAVPGIDEAHVGQAVKGGLLDLPVTAAVGRGQNDVPTTHHPAVLGVDEVDRIHGIGRGHVSFVPATAAVGRRKDAATVTRTDSPAVLGTGEGKAADVGVQADRMPSAITGQGDRRTVHLGLPAAAQQGGQDKGHDSHEDAAGSESGTTTQVRR